MAREYRIECSESIDRSLALEKLGESPYLRRPEKRFQAGEIWLSTAPEPHYPDVRLFPQPFGFFLEITSLPVPLSKSLERWIAQLRSLGTCSIVDNDTDEMVDALR